MIPSPENIDDLAITHPSLHNMRVLKHKEMFGVFNISGDIPLDAGTPAGLFVNDTRILSQWRFLLPGVKLKFLSGGLDQSNLVFSSHLTNYPFTDGNGQVIPENTIHLRREKFLFEDIMHEKITVTNYSDMDFSSRATVKFGCDFKDIFEVRGMVRSKTGAHLDTSYDADSCVTHYTGLDGEDRHCGIHFSTNPDTIAFGEAGFSLSLRPHEEWVLLCQINSLPDLSVVHNYDQNLGKLRDELHQKASDWTEIKTDNDTFNAWIRASSKAISLLTSQQETGPYPSAGIPWFNVPFGRDGIITALQTLTFNPTIAQGVLSYLAENQAASYSDFSEAQPGKILHETRKCEMARTGEVPFEKYYGSVDSTPLFLMLAGAYYQATGDREFIENLRPSLQAALKWIETDGDPDHDGFLEYIRLSEKGLATQGWKDSFDSVFHEDGALAEAPIALCEVQGYTYAAYRAMASLSEIWGDSTEAARLENKAADLSERFNAAFWDEDMQTYVMALDRSKKPCRVRSSNVGHLLFCGIVPEQRAEPLVRMLTGPDFFTGWGIRTVGSKESRYCPISYHNGSVWPHDTAMAAQGFANYGYYKEAGQILRGLFSLAKNVEHMVLPELICGFERKQDDGVVLYPTACAPQAWAAAAIFMAFSAAFGLNLPEKERSEIDMDTQDMFESFELIERGRTKFSWRKRGDGHGEILKNSSPPQPSAYN